jgi:hypothetical protein
MAINELLDPISKVVSSEVYINDKHIDNKAVKDYIESLEIEVNYFRHSILCMFIANEELFTLSIGKSPNALTEKDTIRILFEDKSGSVFDRRFNVIKTTKTNTQTTNRSQQWTILLEDIYGHALNSSNYTRFLTEKGFSGTPFEICQSALNSLFRYPNELLKVYEEKTLSLNAKRNILDFISDDNPVLNFRFSKDLTPIENILKLAEKYNIHVYQDFNTFYIIQNPSFENSEHFLNENGTSLFKELCNGKEYPYKICDKIKQENSLSIHDRANYKISLNLGGKEQVLRELNFEDIIKVIDINNNSDEFKDLRSENPIEVSNSYMLLSTLMSESYKKYLTANNVVIYTRPTLPYCIPGTLTTIDLSTKSEFASKRKQGDFRYSGVWLIRSTTLKILNNQFLIGRMVLCRFDNPADETFEEMADVITSNENDAILTDKPNKPKNLEKQKTSITKSPEELFKSVKTETDTFSQFKSIFLQFTSITDAIDTGRKGVEDFLSVLDTFTDVQPLIEQGINALMPDASENVSESVGETVNNNVREIHPVILNIKNAIDSISEFFVFIKTKIYVICESISPYVDDIEEMVSRIVNQIRRFRSELKNALRMIENLIVTKIKRCADSINVLLSKMIKSFGDSIYDSIMGSTIDNDVKKTITPLLIQQIVKGVLDSLIVNPLSSLVKDTIFETFQKIVNKIRFMSNKIDEIVNKALKPFESVERTVEESIDAYQTVKSIPLRLLNRVQQQGPDVFRKPPKEIINNFETVVNQDIESLKKKREKLLKAMR